MKKTAFAMAAAAALMAAAPANAALACWEQDTAAAAKIRNLQSRLMVAALRCSASGVDVLPAYNRFVIANRSTIQAANGRIKQHFTRGFGDAGERQYDAFATMLANIYGGDETTQQTCGEAEATANEGVAAEGDIMKLLRVADAAGPTPPLPNGECPISFAAVAAPD
jgi:ribosome-binding ATPase YchF (GTP1/OBG family)